jgi:hypothetical protein
MEPFWNRKVRLVFGPIGLTLLLIDSIPFRWMVISGRGGLSARAKSSVLRSTLNLNLAAESNEARRRAFTFANGDSFGVKTLRSYCDESGIEATENAA